MTEEMRDKIIRQSMTEIECMAFNIIRNVTKLRCAMDDDGGDVIKRIRLDVVIGDIKKLNEAIETIKEISKKKG